MALLVHIRPIKQELKAPDKGMYYLSYLKISIIARKHAGTFDFDKFVFITGLHARTAQTHIKRLLEKGLILKKKTGLYQIVSQRKLYDFSDNDFFIRIPEEDILNYSWKSMKSFRAYMSELIYSRSKEEQEKRYKEFRYEINPRDKSRDKIRNERFLETDCHLLMSLEYGHKMLGFAKSTLSGYRRAQDVSKYTHTISIIYDIDQYYKSHIFSEYLDQTMGKVFEWKGTYFHSEVSKRYTSIKLIPTKRLSRSSDRVTKKVTVTQSPHFDESIPF